METPDEQLLTIDGLARRTEMTTRNLRAYRERGLLPPPVMRGRTGFYGAAHIERVELVKRLHERGFSLELIRKLLDADPETNDAVLRFAGIVGGPFTENTPHVLDAATLAAATGLKDTTLLDRAVQVGMLRRLEDGRYATVSDRLVKVAIGLGVVPGLKARDIVDGMEVLRPHTDAIATQMLGWFARLHAESSGDTQAAAEALRGVLPDIVRGLLELSLDDALRELTAEEPGGGATPRL